MKYSMLLFFGFLTLLTLNNCSRDVEVPCQVDVAIVYSPDYKMSIWGLENFSQFDLHKGSKIFDALIANELIDPEQVLVPREITETQIKKVHSQQFLDSLQSKKKIAEYLWFKQASWFSLETLQKKVLKPLRFATGGTLLAARSSLKSGVAVNMGGGFHHSGPHKGEGACVYADVPIAIRVLQAEGGIKKALIIDLDVHQGNGTVQCLQKDPSTFTFSMHEKNIYPFPKQKSDLDVELPTGMNDQEYLTLLKRYLKTLFTRDQFDIVFYIAGCDTIEGDPMAGLKMTAEGVNKRDQMVIDACVKNNLPVVMTLSGGFTKNSWKTQYESIRTLIKKYGFYAKKVVAKK